jgi:glycosyltransferase involved in cell wall biosynthesis
MKSVSIVLPTYNEKQNLEKFVQRVLSQQKLIPNYKIHIVIADSHSTDGTLEIAKRLAKKYKNVSYIDTDKGLGVGLYKGHLYALERIKPDILMQLDADGQVDVSIIPGLISAIAEGYSLALGSRFVTGGKNQLSLSRRLFSKGSSYVCRFIMGPLDIREFTNSARAFTPALFKKINWKRLPWKEQTFIMQPAFLHEAILAGARYKEVPLIFKDRAEGYSKNKTVGYTRDVITYAIDARLHTWGFDIPFFQTVRRLATNLAS